METIPDKEPLSGNKVMDYAEELYGVTFNPKNFKRVVLEPLASAGYITIMNPSKVTGKPFLIYRTEKFANDYLNSLVDALVNTGLAVRQLLRKPLSEILRGSVKWVVRIMRDYTQLKLSFRAKDCDL